MPDDMFTDDGFDSFDHGGPQKIVDERSITDREFYNDFDDDFDDEDL